VKRLKSRKEGWNGSSSYLLLKFLRSAGTHAEGSLVLRLPIHFEDESIGALTGKQYVLETENEVRVSSARFWKREFRGGRLHGMFSAFQTNFNPRPKTSAPWTAKKYEREGRNWFRHVFNYDLHIGRDSVKAEDGCLPVPFLSCVLAHKARMYLREGHSNLRMRHEHKVPNWQRRSIWAGSQAGSPLRFEIRWRETPPRLKTA